VEKMNQKEVIKNNFSKLAGVSYILFPIMLLAGFLMHPDILKIEIMHSAAQLVENFYHQWTYHVGHLIVALAIPFIIIAVVHLALIAKENGSRLAYIGGIIALFGAVILALDKGSLCLVLSGFNTLSESDIQVLQPYLQVLIDKKGLLVINWFIFLLPLGTILQAIGAMKDKIFTKAQGALIVIGLLLLNNPDIEIISTVGIVLMCAGYIPFGIKVFKGDVALGTS
jgi:hypothetical protein